MNKSFEEIVKMNFLIHYLEDEGSNSHKEDSKDDSRESSRDGSGEGYRSDRRVENADTFVNHMK